jgi:NTP pyrophosphatase (non-canonical NTP hydrolase)
MTDKDRINHLDQENRFLLAEKNKWFAQAKSLEKRLGQADDARAEVQTLVLEFARRMDAKLVANRNKGDRAGWLKENVDWLFGRLQGELRELQHEILVAWRLREAGLADPEQARKLADEAADVANFAMMIADWHLARLEGPV